MELGRLRDSYDKENSWLDEMEDDPPIRDTRLLSDIYL